MPDLISRAAAIEAALDGADDWDGGYNLSREEYIRSHMEKVPAVDAIPVEWLREKMKWADDEGDLDSVDIFSWILQTWQNEQEAQDG